jgi:hypothetical protein
MTDMHQLNTQGTAADSERSLGVRLLGNARAEWRLLMRGAGFDKTVAAESIETQEQMNLVTSQDCHEGQGYLFGRPMTGKSHPRPARNTDHFGADGRLASGRGEVIARTRASHYPFPSMSSTIGAG